MIDKDGKLHFYLNDHLGSARMVIDTAGTVEDGYDYFAFGGVRSQTISTGQSYRYTGKPFDNDHSLNLHYYGARYYDGTTGRFISVDPLHSKYNAWSPYAYTVDNPLSHVDPDGKDVVVLNDPKGAHHLGHNGVVIGNDEDGWTYYSYDGDGKYTKKKFATFSEFKKSKEAKRYTNEARFKTTRAEDAKAKDQGDKEIEVERDGSLKQIATNNCGNLVMNVAGAAGVKIGSNPLQQIPNLQMLDYLAEQLRRKAVDELKKNRKQPVQKERKEIERYDPLKEQY